MNTLPSLTTAAGLYTFYSSHLTSLLSIGQLNVASGLGDNIGLSNLANGPIMYLILGVTPNLVDNTLTITQRFRRHMDNKSSISQTSQNIIKIL